MENTNLLKIDKPIRLIELFAGVGSQAKALQRLGANFEHYKISEWEVNATASYKAIHKENDNTDYSAKYTAEQLNEILSNIGISTDGKKPLTLKEISRKNEQWKRTVYNNFKATNNIGSILNVVGSDLEIIDTDKFTYILTYSFPCQDLSLAGKGQGMAKDSGTRSGLLWEVERLLNESKELPQILLMENVTQVHGKKNKEHFDEWIAFLESKGYSNYWKDLNAKNFGIPQNRNRTFMVSVLGDYTYEFPKEFPLELRLKDMLEDSVDEKFYIKNFDSITAVNKEYSMINGGTIGKMHDVSRRVYSDDGISPTIHTCGGGNTEPKVIAGIGEKKSNGGTQWYQQDRVYENNVAISVTTAFNPYYAVQENIVDPFICASRGRNPENPSDRKAGTPTEQRLEPNFSGCTNTLTTVQKDNYVCEPVIVEDFYKNREDRVYKGVAPTLRRERIGLKVAEPTIKKVDIPQTVRVRKYEVDCESLCKMLREHKIFLKMTNQDIANCLNVPLTKVEHWFRQDKCFAIPDEDIWFELKALLGIKIDEFDTAIMTFEEKEGVFEKSNRCYFSNGLAPTLTSTSADEKVIEPQIIREQPLEREGWHNYAKEVLNSEGLCRTLSTQSNNLATKVKEPCSLRIRKLTPKECWRLMGFDDADFEKAATVNSNSQLYKQAGNSIVVDVLCYIFREML